jgi:magnesium-transporting ATPase (P-type)
LHRNLIEERTFDHGHVDDGLTLVGLTGLIDPPRAEAIAAVADCHSAGIAVKMITGDHKETAAAIGRQIGLTLTDKPLTGAEIDALDDAALQAAIARHRCLCPHQPRTQAATGQGAAGGRGGRGDDRRRRQRRPGAETRRCRHRDGPVGV